MVIARLARTHLWRAVGRETVEPPATLGVPERASKARHRTSGDRLAPGDPEHHADRVHVHRAARDPRLHTAPRVGLAEVEDRLGRPSVIRIII